MSRTRFGKGRCKPVPVVEFAMISQTCYDSYAPGNGERHSQRETSRWRGHLRLGALSLMGLWESQRKLTLIVLSILVTLPPTLDSTLICLKMLSFEWPTQNIGANDTSITKHTQTKACRVTREEWQHTIITVSIAQGKSLVMSPQEFLYWQCRPYYTLGLRTMVVKEIDYVDGKEIEVGIDTIMSGSQNKATTKIIRYRPQIHERK